MSKLAGEGIPQAIRSEASRWLAFRVSGAEGDELEFAEWLNADPRHRRAYQQISGLFDASGDLTGMSSGHGRELGKAPFFMRRSTHVGLAACVGIVFAGVLAVAVLQFGPANGLFSTAQAATYETKVGEIRTIRLDDGTVVTLDTQTVLKVPAGADARQVTLVQGRARFKVAAGEKPFVVTLTTGELRSLGSTFDVSLVSADAEVSALQGSVELYGNSSSQGGSFVLASGKSTQLISQPEVRPMQQSEAGWVSGMLTFESVPLDRAVAAINRYNVIQIRSDTSGLGVYRVSGAFSARDPQSFARAVTRMFKLRSKIEPDTITLNAPVK